MKRTPTKSAIAAGVVRRLRVVIAETGLSQSKFALAIAFDVNRLKAVLAGKTSAPLELVAFVAVRFRVDARWLITGLHSSLKKTWHPGQDKLTT